MAQHRLSLEVPHIVNTCILPVYDTSIYSPEVPTTCPILAITPPGFWQATQLGNRAPQFIANLSACDLGIQLSNCDNYNNVLVDGLYIIRWSLSPNDIVFVEYNHLRIATVLTTYMKILCHLNLAACEPDKETQQKIVRLQFIRTLFDAAIAKVEVAHQPEAGMQIYNYARTQLNKLGRYYNCAC